MDACIIVCMQVETKYNCVHQHPLRSMSDKPKHKLSHAALSLPCRAIAMPQYHAVIMHLYRDGQTNSKHLQQ